MTRTEDVKLEVEDMPAVFYLLSFAFVWDKYLMDI
jgi:hypothetical protein